jgi:hypothetical protein
VVAGGFSEVVGLLMPVAGDMSPALPSLRRSQAASARVTCRDGHREDRGFGDVCEWAHACSSGVWLDAFPIMQTACRRTRQPESASG